MSSKESRDFLSRLIRENPELAKEIGPSELMHYGVKRRSGRYPWGSGKNPQRNRNFLAVSSELHSKGVSENDIAKAMGMKTKRDLINYKISM